MCTLARQSSSASQTQLTSTCIRQHQLLASEQQRSSVCAVGMMMSTPLTAPAPGPASQMLSGASAQCCRMHACTSGASMSPGLTPEGCRNCLRSTGGRSGRQALWPCLAALSCCLNSSDGTPSQLRPAAGTHCLPDLATDAGAGAAAGLRAAGAGSPPAPHERAQSASLRFVGLESSHCVHMRLMGLRVPLQGRGWNFAGDTPSCRPARGVLLTFCHTCSQH